MQKVEKLSTAESEAEHVFLLSLPGLDACPDLGKHP
jgi:hypothetical protein